MAEFNQAEELEQVCATAAAQAAHDLPYVEVLEARPYQYHFQSKRWYVEVDLKHWSSDEGMATSLYRVWRQEDDSFAAMKVDIREGEQQ